MRIYLATIIVLLSVFSCKLKKDNTDETVYATVDLKVQSNPFLNCKNAKSKGNEVERIFKKDLFKIKVDSILNQSYSYSNVEGNSRHAFVSQKDTSIKFVIVVEPEINDTLLGKRLMNITPSEGVGKYLLGSDTALFKGSLYKEQKGKGFKFTYENRFQFYSVKTKKLYYIFVYQEGFDADKLGYKSNCEFRNEIASFELLR